MRAVVQRVRSARVEVEGTVVGQIGRGLLVYLGAERGDGDPDLAYVAGKIAGLRVFPDELGKMSESVEALGLEVLVVSQFTLFGDVRKGLRPSFTAAEEPGAAERAYDSLLRTLGARGLRVASGRFRADMQVHSAVDGPVTILIDSRRLL